VKHPQTIKPAIYIFGLAGGAVFIFLLIREGIGPVASAIARTGWLLLAVIFYHLIQTLSDAAGWLVLIPKRHRISLFISFCIHWICESINNLVPTGRVGGDIVLTRIAAALGVPLQIATAAMFVDITVGVATKVVLLLGASVLLVTKTARQDLALPALVAAVLGVVGASGFYAVQRLGIFRVSAKLAARLARSPEWEPLIRSGEALDEAIRQVYTRRDQLAACCFFWTLSWVIACGEIWLTLWAVGWQTGFTTAVILETTVVAVRNAAFLVPGAVGVQEAGYVFIGSLLGLPGDIALALSLIRRTRELLLGIPGLIGWHLLETRRLLQDRP
jgi:putative membrane protein